MTLSSQSEGPGLRGVSLQLTPTCRRVVGIGRAGEFPGTERKAVSTFQQQQRCVGGTVNLNPEPGANLKWLKRCGISDSEDISYRFTPQC